MKFRFTPYLLSAILCVNCCFAQTVKYDQSENAITLRLKKDIYLLASDSLMGRETGTAGEKMASDYIISQYKTIGIAPYFDGNSYTQSYTFKDSPSLGDSNILKIGKNSYSVKKDFYPLSYSASAKVSGQTVNVGYGIHEPVSGYNDYFNRTELKGKIFIIETSLPEEHKTDTNFIKFTDLQRKVDTAVAYGAAGIVFINSDLHSPPPSEKLTTYIIPFSIPVIFIEEDAVSKFMIRKKPAITEISVDIKRDIKTGYNIAAYIDNKAPTTIIIGGHYDHIGMGKENSRYTGTEPQVHNGADDNASGTGAVIELARYFMNSTYKKHNYLFMNFSGEEKGLYGSSNFTKSTYFDTTKVAYMLNLDMVGRYDTTKVGLDIIGTGTSPLWDTLISLNKPADMKIKRSRSGFDGSDQMSFYLKNIPVLFLFTGIHSDYHMPTDDADKINFPGEVKIIKFAEKFIESTDTIVKMPFSKAVKDSSVRIPKFSATLGLVPDHSYEGKGLRVEGTMPDRPAEKAGIKGGDIIIKIGEYDTPEIMSYMKALGHFKKGDKTKVVVKRGDETLTLDVEF